MRVNRCKTTVDKVIRILSGECLRIDHQLEECGPSNVHRDELIDCVLRVPRSVDLHAHPLVLSQSIVLQTKASCFPPFLLLNDLYDGTKKLPSRCDVIDATAAPGNKTTFLGDILRSQSSRSCSLTQRNGFRLRSRRLSLFGAARPLQGIWQSERRDNPPLAPRSRASTPTS